MHGSLGCDVDIKGVTKATSGSRKRDGVEQAKQEHILTCAARFFARFGFRKTSMAAIANEAGVAKGTVYLAAESKRDLFFRVLHREIREGVAYAAQRIDPRKPADELLAVVLAADFEYFDDRPLVRDLLVGRASRTLEDDVSVFEELRRMARANMGEVIRLGQRQGLFRRDVDVDQVTVLLQDLQVATLLFHDHLENICAIDHPRWRSTLDIFLRGLKVNAS